MKARIEYKILLLVNKALRYNEPTYLKTHLNKLRLDTNVMVRHMSDEHRLFEPRTNSKLGERTFKYSAPRLYNNLPSEMKSIQEEVYKRKLKTLLFGQSYDAEDLTIKPRFEI